MCARRGSQQPCAPCRGGRGGRGTHERVGGLPAELLAEKGDDGAELVACCDLVEVLLHDGRVARCLEADDDCEVGEGQRGEEGRTDRGGRRGRTFREVLLLGRVECLSGCELAALGCLCEVGRRCAESGRAGRGGCGAERRHGCPGEWKALLTASRSTGQLVRVGDESRVWSRARSEDDDEEERVALVNSPRSCLREAVQLSPLLHSPTAPTPAPHQLDSASRSPRPPLPLSTFPRLDHRDRQQPQARRTR